MEESINKQLSRLLGEIKKGHAKALGGIQLLLESRLSKVISGFFLQEADREDILEDTYLRIVLEIHTYKRDENPSAWIIRILKSIIFTKLKKQKREVSIGRRPFGKEGHVQFARERRIYRKLSFDKKSI